MTTLQHSPVAAYQRSLLSRPSTKPFSSSPPPLAPPPPSSTSSSAVGFSSLRLLLPSFSTRAVLDSRARRGGCGPLRAARGDSAAASYATALLELAESGNSLDATCEDIGKVEKIFSDDQVFDLVVDPTLDAEQKLAFIDEIATSAGLREQTVDFLKVLIDADRIDIVLDVVKEFEQLYDDLTGTEVAVVSSVVELENQHLAQIAKGIQQLTGAKNIRVKTVIDDSLLAGLTIKYGKTGSNFIDMSVKKQLDEIAANLESGDLQFAI